MGRALNLLAMLLFTWCSLDHRVARAEEIALTFLHFNDVYEIVKPRKGEFGGLARVAALRDALKKKNLFTYTVVAGDLLSPSPMGSASMSGEKLAGRQMLSVLSVLGVDYATFGNHEFDLERNEFHRGLVESKFCWFSTNVMDKGGSPFPHVPRHVILDIPGRHEHLRVGVIGLTIDMNKTRDYMRYLDFVASARAEVRTLRGSCDLVIAVTHLSLEQDKVLAAAVPEISLILGGHEHKNSYDPPTAGRSAPIAKADANARTAYVHELRFDTLSRTLRIQSRLRVIGPDLDEKEKSPTAQAIELWTKLGFEALKDDFRKDRVRWKDMLTVLARLRDANLVQDPLTDEDLQNPLFFVGQDLEGRDEFVRQGPTNLTRFLMSLISLAVPDADLAVLNSGAIRIDDRLSSAVGISLYDALRVSPYAVKIYLAEMRGSLLKMMLDKGQSASARGEGGFLQLHGAELRHGTWFVGNKKEAVTDSSKHLVAIGDYLLMGRERLFAGFLNTKRKEVGDLSYEIDHVALKRPAPLVGDLAALFVDGLNRARLGKLVIEPSPNAADPPPEEKYQKDVFIRCWPRREDSRSATDP